jgi:hypothetical protein
MNSLYRFGLSIQKKKKGLIELVCIWMTGKKNGKIVESILCSQLSFLPSTVIFDNKN